MTNKDKLDEIFDTYAYIYSQSMAAGPKWIFDKKNKNKAKQAIQKDYIEKSELPEHKPYKCEKGHVQVKKCQFGHEIYAHSARWCCACDADIAFATAWVKDEPEFKDKYIEKSRVVEAIGTDERLMTYKGAANLNDETNKAILERNKFRKQLKTQLGLEEK